MPDNPITAEPQKPQGRWFQFRLRTLLVVVTAIPTLIFVCDRSGVSIADGWLDVEMLYQVVDAETGCVVPDATVEFMDDSAPFNPTQSGIMSLRTNTNGIASRVFHNAGCTWRTGTLGLSETFFAGGGVPWALRVSSTGYQPTDWLCPNTRDFDWRSEYLGNHKARATISLPLRRLAAAQPMAQ